MNKRHRPEPTMTTSERDDYEERAAILEFEAGFSRAEAERRAAEMVRQGRSLRGL